MDLLIHKCFLRLLSEENSKKDVMGLTMRLFFTFSYISPYSGGSSQNEGSCTCI